MVTLEPEGDAAPRTGMRRMFREFWFQVGVAVTATVIATVAIAVVPRITDSGGGVQKVQSAGAVETTTSAPGPVTTTAAGPVAAPPTSAAAAAAVTTQPPATVAPSNTAAKSTAAASPTTAAPTTAAPVTTVAAPTSAKVPDVKGATLSNATTSLKAAGFNDVQSTTGCLGGGPGTVVTQSPAAGQTAAFTTTMRLQVEASNCAVVPNVVGQQLQSAADKVNGAGFHDIPYRYECLGSPNTGAVVTQSPPGGTDTTTDTPVTLRLQANNCS